MVKLDNFDLFPQLFRKNVHLSRLNCVSLSLQNPSHLKLLLIFSQPVWFIVASKSYLMSWPTILSLFFVISLMSLEQLTLKIYSSWITLHVQMKFFITRGNLVLMGLFISWILWKHLMALALTIWSNCLLRGNFRRLGLIGYLTCIYLVKLGWIWMNGKIGDWIFCRHGLRQGDPLSLFLYILAVDPFCRMFNAVVLARIFEGLGNPWICGETKLLQYADDILIFSRTKRKYCIVLKIIVYSFELILWFMINFHKSSINFLHWS